MSSDREPRPVLSVEALRRASPLPGGSSPTRTLRITEAEYASRDTTPVSDLLFRDRPRSNPRSRTPMRYVSPLDPSEFRRESIEEEEVVVATPVERNEARRISIRPMAGRAVGTVASTRIHEERPATPKSRKQGPSHRKIRRWNNDHFVGLANEIAKSSGRGHIAAEVLLRAQEDAHLYREIVDPNDLRSERMTRFMEDEKLKGLRERFFEGEGPILVCNPSRSHRRNRRGPVTPEEQMCRIDHRLRQVVVKACANSYPATKVVSKMEDFICETFAPSVNDERPESKLESDWWKDLLMESPTVIGNESSSDGRTVKFYFDAESSTGGFHRLLVHAVAQFHGLAASSRITKVTLEDGSKTKTRALIVSGCMNSEEPPLRLLDHLGAREEQP